MASPPFAAPLSDPFLTEIVRQRKLFCNKAVEGSLAMFSAWSTTPDLALRGFQTCLDSCRETLSAPPMARSAYAGSESKRAHLVSAAAERFEFEASSLTRSEDFILAWRSAFSDAYALASDGLAPAERLALLGSAPPWLLKLAIERSKPTREALASTAAVFIKQRHLASAALCLAPGKHFFSRLGHGTQSLMSPLLTQIDWAKSRSAGLDRAARTLSMPDYACQTLALDIERSYWTETANARALEESFAGISSPEFEALPALLLHICAPGIGSSLSLDWARVGAPGSISGPDAVFSMYFCPQAALRPLCLILNSLAEPSIDLLHAALTRLGGASPQHRESLLRSCDAWSEALLCSDPQSLLALSSRAQAGHGIKTLGTNAYELGIRACMQNKSSTGAGAAMETSLMERVLSRVLSAGFDTEALGPDGAPSSMAKLRQSKNPEALFWITRMEAAQISHSIPDIPSNAANAPRL